MLFLGEVRLSEGWIYPAELELPTGARNRRRRGGVNARQAKYGKVPAQLSYFITIGGKCKLLSKKKFLFSVVILNYILFGENSIIFFLN